MERERVRVKASSRPMLTVVPFVPAPPDVNLELLERIDEFAAMIEAGEIRCMAIAAVTHDGHIATTKAGDGGNFQLIGAMFELSQRLSK